MCEQALSVLCSICQARVIVENHSIQHDNDWKKKSLICLGCHIISIYSRISMDLIKPRKMEVMQEKKKESS